MKINNISDLITYKESIRQEENKLTEKLEKLIKQPDKCLNEIIMIKSRLSELNKEYLDIYYKLISLVSFPSKEISEFLVKFLNEVYDEEYVLTNLSEKSYSDDPFDSDEVYFVSKKNDSKKIKKDYNNFISLDKITSDLENAFYFDEKYDTFFDNKLLVKKEYQAIPKLTETIYHLADLKLRFPDMSNEERFNNSLKRLKQKKKIR